MKRQHIPINIYIIIHRYVTAHHRCRVLPIDPLSYPLVEQLELNDPHNRNDGGYVEEAARPEIPARRNISIVQRQQSFQ